jgi:hypothetical protein
MAKKNSGKIVQMVSPINYIRTKARTLPIFECWINSNWEEISQVSCIVSRKHSNGNISYCFYFVDLLCLGVDLTYFKFNESLSQYKKYLAQTEEELSLELVRVDYALVHNVIHVGILYAEGFEFKAHKDFTSITQYFLEEHNDVIEFMEIECGDDEGQPIYVYSSLKTNPREKDRIIAQLERTAGPENYTIIDLDDTTAEDDDFEDDFEDQEDIYYQNTFEQNREIFIDLYDGLNDSDGPLDVPELLEVTEALFFEISDEAMVKQYYDEYLVHVLIDLISVGVEPLGVRSGVQISDQVSELFMTVFNNIHKNLKKARKALELMKMETEVVPAVAFLELLIFQKEKADKYDEILQKYISVYPDYPMITLLWLINIFSSEFVPQNIANKTFNMETLFPGRDSLHYLEMYYYLLFISKKVAYERDVDKMEAFYQVLDDFDLPINISTVVKDQFSIARVEYLAHYFNLENN